MGIESEISNEAILHKSEKRKSYSNLAANYVQSRAVCSNHPANVQVSVKQVEGLKWC